MATATVADEAASTCPPPAPPARPRVLLVGTAFAAGRRAHGASPA